MAGVTLHLTSSFEAAWGGVCRPWLESAGAAAWKQTAPTAVVVPSRPYGSFLKSRMVTEGLNVAGVRFWTPWDARAVLAPEGLPSSQRMAPADVHLLVAEQAERMADQPAARTVAAGPAVFAQSMARLILAGAGPDAYPSETLRSLGTSARKRWTSTGFLLDQEIDRALADQPVPESAALHQLLIIGFDGAQWEYWFLLNALVKASRSADVVLLTPRYQAEAVDFAWVGSWEERYAEVQPVAEPDETARSLFYNLADQLENADATGTASAPVDFHFGYDLREQTEAIVTQALVYLAQPDCNRLGILFPGYGALSREVAARLKRLELPHNDTLGCFAPILPDSRRWKAWLRLQAQPRLASLLELIKVFPEAAGSFTDRPEAFEKALDRAFTELLVDDLAVLRGWLADSPSNTHKEAADVLGRLLLLPAQGTLSVFLEAAGEALERIGWPEIIPRVRNLATVPDVLIKGPLSRNAFLQWLEGIGETRIWTRDVAGAHPFARTQLMAYRHAEWQCWSHLILTDLNENYWPPPVEPEPFMGEERINALNQEAIIEGSQGEGHLTVKEGKSLLVGPQQRRAQAYRQFHQLIESVQHGLCATASLCDEIDPAHRRIPSGLLLHLYYTCTGHVLSDDVIDNLHLRTRAFLTDSSTTTSRVALSGAHIASTRKAYEARRQPDTPFNEYGFALTKPPTSRVVFACSEWDQLIRHPAGLWLQAYLGVSPRRLDTSNDPARKAMGILVHHWMRQVVSKGRDDWIHVPEFDTLIERLQTQADTARSRIKKAFHAAGRTLPDWHRSHLEQCQWIAHGLISRMLEIDSYSVGSTESRLPDNLEVPIGDSQELTIKGRIDLLLTEGRPNVQVPERCLVMDYKTGSSTGKLTPKSFATNLGKGTGIQMGLYALALQALGAKEIEVALLNTEGIIGSRIELDHVLEGEPFWAELVRMSKTGIFGMLAELRPEFSTPCDYPMATLPIDVEILNSKWALTHPGFVSTKDSKQESTTKEKKYEPRISRMGTDVLKEEG